ncbi:helix-turn-helix transcriptional regulator [Herbiconiux ginsengi]|uniref:Transcriptional regulator, LuxR family n=1 Tax=Herbiconiux ginsengi TaxID=381665 RepID=A0A1H3KDH8_9MICO|nr:LuxR family transcriptional regulator [Herbiconiux ginsengi]SDY50166.1 transcriptional regulator, LuxR family [Herbiconiux ginsengi]
MIGIDTVWADHGVAVGHGSLVGRSGLVDLAFQRWQSAVQGDGRLLLFAGEAGIGKSRLVREFSARIGESGRILGASLWPKDAQVGGSILLDLADDLGRHGDPAHAEHLRSLLLGSRDDSDALARRVLLRDLVDVLLEVLGDAPTVLRFEDLHWADELSLDVLARLAPELLTTPGLVIGTYRTDEVYAGTALAEWRGRLLAQRLADEVRIPRLDLTATGELVTALTGAVPSSEFVELLHSRSDGIPLHIEELLVAGVGDRVPDTLADAVRARADSLDPSTHDVLSAAAIVGCRFDLVLLTDLVGDDDRVVDRAMKSLLDRYFIVETDAGFEFRHALVRDVVHDDLPPIRRRSLHEEVAKAAIVRHARPAYISEQYELAQLPDRAHPFALEAARLAARVSAHRESAKLYARALRTLPSVDHDRVAKNGRNERPDSDNSWRLDDGADARGSDEAVIHGEFARELAAVDDIQAAADHFRIAVELYRDRGDPISAARLVPQLAAARHLLGDTREARCALLQGALDDLDSLPGGAPPAVRAELLGALAAAHMLDRRLDTGLAFGEEAQGLARSVGDDCLGVDIDSTLGAILVFAGRGEEGWALLEHAVAEGTAAGFEPQTARAYRMAGSSASVLVEYPRAERMLTDGIRYAATTENWNDHHYLTAHLAHVRWAQGRWAEAEALALRALAEGGGITTRITALHVLGYLAVGRDEPEQAEELLTEALEIGERMGELQRLSPALWGLTELAVSRGDTTAAIALSERAYESSALVGDAAYLYPFVVPGVRARLAARDPAAARDWRERCRVLLELRGIPGTLPALEHADALLQLSDGRTDAARATLRQVSASWDAHGRFWEGTQVLVDQARCASRSRRPAQCDAFLADARRRAEGAGARLLLRLARQAERRGDEDSAGPLTAREFEVARLVAAGSTNREIGSALSISPKTASVHVEHILAKLGATRRAEIASWFASARDAE